MTGLAGGGPVSGRRIAVSKPALDLFAFGSLRAGARAVVLVQTPPELARSPPIEMLRRKLLWRAAAACVCLARTRCATSPVPWSCDIEKIRPVNDQHRLGLEVTRPLQGRRRVGPTAGPVVFVASPEHLTHPAGVPR